MKEDYREALRLAIEHLLFWWYATARGKSIPNEERETFSFAFHRVMDVLDAFKAWWLHG